MIDSSEVIEARAEALISIGFKFYDALHIALAEAANVNVLLTTDDRLLRRALKYEDELRVTVENPVTWFMKLTQPATGEDNDTN